MGAGTRMAWAWVVFLTGGCAAGAMDLPAEHPGNPAAPAAPVIAPSNVLAEHPAEPAGEAAEEEPPAGGHEHHHHRHHGG